MNPRRTVKIVLLLGLVAVMALSCFAWDRISRWQCHRTYLAQFPEVAPLKPCSDVSGAFWTNIWRIPASVRKFDPSRKTWPFDDWHKGPPDILYSFVWFECEYAVDTKEEELLRELEGNLRTGGWDEVGKWSREGLDKMSYSYHAGVLDLFESQASSGYLRYYRHEFSSGKVWTVTFLYVACWRENEKLKMKAVGVRNERRSGWGL